MPQTPKLCILGGPVRAPEVVDNRCHLGGVFLRSCKKSGIVKETMHRINKHKRIKDLVLALMLVSASVLPLVASPVPVFAATQVVCPDGHTKVDASKVDTCPDAADSAVTSGNCKDVKGGKCDLIKNYIQPLIDLLSAGVGVAVVISIIIGGIQYSSSAGDSSKITAAKNRIRNSIIALLMFLFLVAFLNFLIPGGLV